jgi:stearoyl-CoA desaturase (Delta-9 desaturase)
VSIHASRKFILQGWVTDLKTVSTEMLKNRVLRTGDGSHGYSKSNLNSDVNQNDDTRDVNHFWGFGDKEMANEDMEKIAIIRNLNA